MQKILVGVIGSEKCSKVAEEAQKLALLCAGEVTFLTIINPKFKLITSKKKLEEENLEIEAEKSEKEEALKKCSMLYESCKYELGKEGVKTKRVIKEGNYPADDICNYAEENDFDLIVIADKGDNSIKEFLLGSTTEKIIRHAKTSVLVVK